MDPRQEHQRRSADSLAKPRVGQIIGLDKARGLATVRLRGSPVPVLCVIPADVFVSGPASSWHLHMPRVYSFVLVQHTVDNLPIITRIYPYGIGPLLGETPHAVDQHLGGVALMDTAARNAPTEYLDWNTLDESEWSYRTLGGALFTGRNSGDLILASDRSFFRVARGQSGLSEIFAESGRLRFASGASSLILGDQRRKALPTDLTDGYVFGGQAEYDLTVAAQVAPGVAADFKRHIVGPHITAIPAPGGATAVPVLSNQGLPVVETDVTYSGAPGGPGVLTRTVDAGGNVTEAHPLATNVTVSAPLAAMALETRQVALGLAPIGGVGVGPNIQAALSGLVGLLQGFTAAVAATATLPAGKPEAIAAAAAAFLGALPTTMQPLIQAIPSTTVTTSL